jgi:hypothetical protein
LPTTLIAASAAFMSWWKFGSPLGTGYTMWDGNMYEHSIAPWTAVRNLFFDPQWNLPLHFPLLLLAPFGARDFYRRFAFDAWIAGGVFALAVLLIGTMPVWKGEWSYGPRYFLFALPALSAPGLLLIARFLSASERRRPATGALLAISVFIASASAYLQFQVLRLDPFFCYWIRPSPRAFQDPAVRSFFDRTPFPWIAREAWSQRERTDELWWMRQMKSVLTSGDYAREKDRVDTWLRRTNFYWWSPRD